MIQARLVNNCKEKPNAGGGSTRTQGTVADTAVRAEKIRRSALWAAYGDALGWISELTDKTGLLRRTAGAPLYQPIEWKRRIGGRSGITVTLPKGCYSDDSQLRLATCRAIQPDGFDVEVFSKVELPVWLSYALGGGKSTSAAAMNLARPRVQWFANTFKGWTHSGGNGAAMRIQPHVWAARSPDVAESFLPNVIRNTVCTHSHPNGLLGSCLHALTLAHAMVTESHVTFDDLMKAVETAAVSVPEVIRKEVELGQLWLATFEREAGEFNTSWKQAVEECREAIRIAAEVTESKGAKRYDAIVNELRLRDPERRGSGVLTSIAAVALLWCETRPEEALRIAANAIGTDTDTIATMAGAILGATAKSEPPVEVLDASVFRSEADRLAEIAYGGNPPSHQYPDLLHWNAPKTRSDALIRIKNGSLYVRGLGRAEAQSAPLETPDPKFNWQWVRLETGQNLLIKRRRDLARQTLASGPTFISGDSSITYKPDKTNAAKHKISLVRSSQAILENDINRESRLDLHTALEYVEEHIDNDLVLGKAVRRVIRIGTTQQILDFMSKLVHFLGPSADDKQVSNH